ncbi:hypothetical protein VNO80_16268 [Phaseolus coccineus]|uniref:Uncharacterized protein n=1 Tax=Phaseolus coccineus TaxID=3886 RepID=A0AAN9R2J4_PHACN
MAVSLRSGASCSLVAVLSGSSLNAKQASRRAIMERLEAEFGVHDSKHELFCRAICCVITIWDTVENAWSSIGGDLGVSPLHDFASRMENAMSSIGRDLGISHSPMHGFQLFTLVELAA